ncbi:MAG: hypothetical protein KDB79_11355 [Acidobacteria bacterium]|nr:hypothetical protein [Acidobacteriota bacterium]
MIGRILLVFSFVVFGGLGLIAAQDKVSEIKLSVLPKTAKIRPHETAIIQTEFYGTKKKSFLGSLVDEATGKSSQIQSTSWKATVANNAGMLSKPFLFQKEGERVKSGFANFLKQGLEAAAAKDSVLYTAPGKPGKYTIKITNGGLSKDIVIVVSNSAPSSNRGKRKSFPAEAPSSDPYFYLAEHYAPFIAQETWFEPGADHLVRADYDGDWKADNNWENLDKGSPQAYVYYTVIESETHWFLIYNFFHARDYSDVCVVGTCHENDNEGLIMTVRKNKTKFGELEVMETLAHNNIYSFSNDSSIKKGVHDIDGKIEFYKKTTPIVFIEAGGHGVYSSSAKGSLFSAEKMEFKSHTGITYVYKNKAEIPTGGNNRNVGYALLPIYDQWWSKGNQKTADANDTFDDFYAYQPFGDRPGTSAEFISGAFKGRTASENKAKPFWGWHDKRTRDKKVLNTGQWALDPAYSVSQNLSFPSDKPVSTTYIFNPFLAVQQKEVP